MASQSGFLPSSTAGEHRSLGENGSPEFTSAGVEDARVALFFALVRDLPLERLHFLLRNVISAEDHDTAVASGEFVADAFVMAFQTRNCRGGKAERNLFYRMIMELAVDFPDTVMALMPLVPHFGSYKDWFQIVALANDAQDEIKVAMEPIAKKILQLAKDQLIKDKEILESNASHNKESKNTKLSLIAKWAPRENKTFGKQVKELSSLIFPDSNTPKKDYRKMVSLLNTAINTVEIKMSSNQWDTIDFKTGVPSVCLMKNRKAFLNEKVKGPPPESGEEEETGNRHPDNPTRVSCRKRLRDAMLDTRVQKLKGRQLFPHEITSKMEDSYYNGRSSLSTLEKELLACQWKDIRQGVMEAMKKVHEEQVLNNKPNSSSAQVDLGNLVSLVDVSGSMTGTPMEVAIALGLLISELASPAFAHRCLTFSEMPDWVELREDMSLDSKVAKMRRAPWGGSTNFEAATEKILQIAIKNKLKPDEIPNMIVFSDMQFDQARNQSAYAYQGVDSDSRWVSAWETHHERIVRRFKETGMNVCGKAWPAPEIIYWNLRGDTNGFPAQANTPGVTMLSGYSPALMKLLLNGDPIGFEDEEESKQPSKRTDPYTMLRSSLDDEQYDIVRQVLHLSEEGALKHYRKNIDHNKKKQKASDWVVV